MSFEGIIKLGGGPMKKLIQLAAILLAVLMILDSFTNANHIKKLSKPYY